MSGKIERHARTPAFGALGRWHLLDLPIEFPDELGVHVCESLGAFVVVVEVA
jgi:hypothetical protein